jgi:hypothetical protein
MMTSEHPTHLPLTSRVWFLPALILLMPLLSRACMDPSSSKPRPASSSEQQLCRTQYEQCMSNCYCSKTCAEEYEFCLETTSDVRKSDWPDAWTCGRTVSDDEDDWGERTLEGIDELDTPNDLPTQN